MKKILFPVLLVALGTGSAFATMSVKQSTNALESAYVIVDEGGGQFRCEDADQECSDVALGPFCIWEQDNTTELRSVGSGTMCGNKLHQIPQ